MAPTTERPGRGMSSNEETVRAGGFCARAAHDVERAAEFYGTTLGLRRSVYMPERNFAEFETGNLTLSVIHAEKMGLEHHVSGNAIALHVDDVEAARKKIKSRADLQRRHARHERVPHGLLQRPRRQRADAPPPLRTPGPPRTRTARWQLTTLLPGARELLAIHERELPQRDDLCGAFCGSLALARRRDRGPRGEPLDQDAVALAGRERRRERPWHPPPRRNGPPRLPPVDPGDRGLRGLGHDRRRRPAGDRVALRRAPGGAAARRALERRPSTSCSAARRLRTAGKPDRQPRHPSPVGLAGRA